MNSRPLRLKNRQQFLRIANLGVWDAQKTVVVQAYCFQEQISESCESKLAFGVTATRKRVGNAVKRNRAKRRLRHLAMQVLADQGLKQCHYVLVAREDTGHCPFKRLETDCIKGIKRCHKKLADRGLLEL